MFLLFVLGHIIANEVPVTILLAYSSLFRDVFVMRHIYAQQLVASISQRIEKTLNETCF